MNDKIKFNDKIEYTIEHHEGKKIYIGTSAHFPGVTVQADSLEEMQQEIKTTALLLISMFLEFYNSGRPFTLEEQTPSEFIFGKPNEKSTLPN